MENQFLRPDRENSEFLRRMGYAFVDLIIDRVLSNDQSFVEDLSPYSLHISQQPRQIADILQELQTELLPRTLNLHHPGYMGHMDSVPLAITIWGDALIAALNNNMLSEELSPLFTQLEAQLLAWFGHCFGMGADCFGTLTAGGSLANITALLVARNHFCPESRTQGVTKPLFAFVSEAAHTSFEKGMNVLGLGKNHLIRIPTTDRGEMIVEALEAALEKVLAQGGTPFFIAAIAGTTVTGAIDAIPEVEALARRYGCWFHVDAAYGGAVIFSPQWQFLLKGIDRADSITFNPQKWMWISRTCAMLLVKERHLLEAGFAQHLPYMQLHQLNFGNLTLQGTRRTDCLKLWLALQALGTTGFAELIDRSMSHTAAFCTWIDQHKVARLICQPTINIACLVPTNPQISPQELQKQWQMQGYWLSLPLWKGNQILKAVILHPYPSGTCVNIS